MLMCRLLIFFKINFLKFRKILSGMPSVSKVMSRRYYCRTVRDSVWGRPSDIVRKKFQRSESLLSSLDSLSETIFRSAYCTVMHSDAIVFLFYETIADWPNFCKR